jgi:hypothetical protein
MVDLYLSLSPHLREALVRQIGVQFDASSRLNRRASADDTDAGSGSRLDGRMNRKRL